MPSAAAAASDSALCQPETCIGADLGLVVVGKDYQWPTMLRAPGSTAKAQPMAETAFASSWPVNCSVIGCRSGVNTSARAEGTFAAAPTVAVATEKLPLRGFLQNPTRADSWFGPSRLIAAPTSATSFLFENDSVAKIASASGPVAATSKIDSVPPSEVASFLARNDQANLRTLADFAEAATSQPVQTSFVGIGKDHDHPGHPQEMYEKALGGFRTSMVAFLASSAAFLNAYVSFNLDEEEYKQQWRQVEANRRRRGTVLG
eukprot:TRINITY_DN30483_c0_g1_i1.p1 TRINITY_DN30483_c0_g1~~TRINITY_DN30483_c0_g1_i1.p1  ORF type:complete len:285 (+),score=40.67 TRINITY_DN30483_c0_g1_i1:75-857(+)